MPITSKLSATVLQTFECMTGLHELRSLSELLIGTVQFFLITVLFFTVLAIQQCAAYKAREKHQVIPPRW